MSFLTKKDTDKEQTPVVPGHMVSDDLIQQPAGMYPSTPPKVSPPNNILKCKPFISLPTAFWKVLYLLHRHMSMGPNKVFSRDSTELSQSCIWISGQQPYYPESSFKHLSGCWSGRCLFQDSIPGLHTPLTECFAVVKAEARWRGANEGSLGGVKQVVNSQF